MKAVIPVDAIIEFDTCGAPAEAAFASWLLVEQGATLGCNGSLIANIRCRLIAGHAAMDALPAGTQLQSGTKTQAAPLQDAVCQTALRDAEERAARAESRAREAEADCTTRLVAAQLDADARVQRADERAARVMRDADDARARAFAEAGGLSSGARLAELQAAVACLAGSVERMTAGTRSAEEARLGMELAAAVAECERLRGCNHVKGALGEAAVMTALQEAFPSWAFLDTSAKGAQSDFHMTSPCGAHIVAVEVKNKATVTSGDVDKSVRDVGELADRLGGRLVGYVFVSLRSRNIPRKGALAVERVSGVPVMWYGAELPNPGMGMGVAGAELARFVQLLVDIGLVLAADSALPAQAEAERRPLLAHVDVHLRRLDTMRRAVDALQDAATTARKQAAVLAASLDAAYRELQAGVRSGVVDTADTASLQAVPEGLGSPQRASIRPENARAQTELTPAPCGRVFLGARGVAAHKVHCRECGSTGTPDAPGAAT